MSITITAENGIEFEVCGLGVAVVDHGEETETWARLSAEQRRALADALRGREPGDEYVDWKSMYDQVRRERDAAVYAYDKAERERDAAVARAEKAEADAKRYSDKFNRAREANRRLADQLAEARTAPAVTRDDIDRALINVTSNAMNYPTPSQMLGKDSGPLRRKCVDAVCDLFGIEAEAVVDPVEAKARAEADRRYSGDPNHAFIEGAVWAARRLNEQEADDE